jgi:hypothetical protein
MELKVLLIAKTRKRAKLIYRISDQIHYCKVMLESRVKPLVLIQLVLPDFEGTFAVTERRM